MARNWPWQRKREHAAAEVAAPAEHAPGTDTLQRAEAPAAAPATAPAPSAPAAESSPVEIPFVPARRAAPASAASADGLAEMGATGGDGSHMLMLGATGGLNETAIFMKESLETSARLGESGFSDMVMRSFDDPSTDLGADEFTGSLASLMSFSDPHSIIEGGHNERPFGKRIDRNAAPPEPDTSPLALLRSLESGDRGRSLEMGQPAASQGASLAERLQRLTPFQPANAAPALPIDTAKQAPRQLRRFSEAISHESPSAPASPLSNGDPFVARSVPVGADLPTLPQGTGRVNRLAADAPTTSTSLPTLPGYDAAVAPRPLAAPISADGVPSVSGPVTLTEPFRGRRPAPSPASGGGNVPPTQRRVDTSEPESGPASGGDAPANAAPPPGFPTPNALPLRDQPKSPASPETADGGPRPITGTTGEATAPVMSDTPAAGVDESIKVAAAAPVPAPRDADSDAPASDPGSMPGVPLAMVARSDDEFGAPIAMPFASPDAPEAAADAVGTHAAPDAPSVGAGVQSPERVTNENAVNRTEDEPATEATVSRAVDAPTLIPAASVPQDPEPPGAPPVTASEPAAPPLAVRVEATPGEELSAVEMPLATHESPSGRTESGSGTPFSTVGRAVPPDAASTTTARASTAPASPDAVRSESHVVSRSVDAGAEAGAAPASIDTSRSPQSGAPGTPNAGPGGVTGDAMAEPLYDARPALISRLAERGDAGAAGEPDLASPVAGNSTQGVSPGDAEPRTSVVPEPGSSASELAPLEMEFRRSAPEGGTSPESAPPTPAGAEATDSASATSFTASAEAAVQRSADRTATDDVRADGSRAGNGGRLEPTDGPEPPTTPGAPNGPRTASETVGPVSDAHIARTVATPLDDPAGTEISSRASELPFARPGNAPGEGNDAASEAPGAGPVVRRSPEDTASSSSVSASQPDVAERGVANAERGQTATSNAERGPSAPATAGNVQRSPQNVPEPQATQPIVTPGSPRTEPTLEFRRDQPATGDPRSGAAPGENRSPQASGNVPPSLSRAVHAPSETSSRSYAPGREAEVVSAPDRGDRVESALESLSGPLPNAGEQALPLPPAASDGASASTATTEGTGAPGSQRAAFAEEQTTEGYAPLDMAVLRRVDDAAAPMPDSIVTPDSIVEPAAAHTSGAAESAGGLAPAQREAAESISASAGAPSAVQRTPAVPAIDSAPLASPAMPFQARSEARPDAGSGTERTQIHRRSNPESASAAPATAGAAPAVAGQGTPSRASRSSSRATTQPGAPGHQDSQLSNTAAPAPNLEPAMVFRSVPTDEAGTLGNFPTVFDRATESETAAARPGLESGYVSAAPYDASGVPDPARAAKRAEAIPASPASGQSAPNMTLQRQAATPATTSQRSSAAAPALVHHTVGTSARPEQTTSTESIGPMPPPDMPLVTPPAAAATGAQLQRKADSAPLDMPLVAPPSISRAGDADSDSGDGPPPGVEAFGRVSREVTIDEVSTSSSQPEVKEPDIDALTDRVWERIRRKLRVERERTRGVL